MAMTVRTTDLNQQATYWGPRVNDGLGGGATPAPVLIACRWQDRNDRVQSATGDEVVTSSIVYVDRHLELGGFLAQGDLTAQPAPTSVAKIIVALGSSPDLSASQELLKVWL